MNEQTYDLVRIKQTTSLLALIEKDTPLKVKSHGPYGIEYAGPCPICHGAKRDGFIVQPEHKPYPVWFCRKHTGPAALSVLDYVAQREGLNINNREGLDRIVNILTGGNPPTMSARPAAPARQEPPAKQPPAQAWQTAAQVYIPYTERQLWSPAGKKALEYLRKERGLCDETIKRFRLGYNPIRLYRPAEKWGTPNGNDKDLTLWAGIVIPWIIGGEVWAINTRQMGSVAPKDRYKKVRGSRGAVFNADRLETASVALYVEGELDVMLAQQEAGGRLAVLSLGSGSGTPDEAVWAYHFYKPNLTMFLPDNDAAGWETFGKFAAKQLARYLVAVGLPDNSKDLGDYYRAGGNVQAWINDTLQAHDPVYSEISALAAELGATVREI
jgi:DNA primase